MMTKNLKNFIQFNTQLNIAKFLEDFGDVTRMVLIQLLMLPTLFYFCWLIQNLY